MDILLTNDDGIDAPGIRALADALETIRDVTVVAPATNQSAVGRGLSYGRMGPETDNASDTGLGDGTDDPFTVTISTTHTNSPATCRCWAVPISRTSPSRSR